MAGVALPAQQRFSSQSSPDATTADTGYLRRLPTVSGHPEQKMDHMNCDTNYIRTKNVPLKPKITVLLVSSLLPRHSKSFLLKLELL